ncbi:MAG: type II secretion system F family protein [Patescibacteria group bacterium]|nr:type II secretion system F family protein [Patescibacteria group bacterium]
MQYSYKAKNKKGEITTGEMSAQDIDELSSKLSRLGSVLMSSEEIDKKKGNIEISKILKRVSIVDKMLFTRHLGVMLRAGLPFSRAVTVLAEQTSNAYFKDILLQVKEDIQKGNQLGSSLEKHPKAFNSLFVNMIRVGETSGNLEEVLDILYVQLKKDHQLTSKIKGAMMYPSVIVFAMVVIGALMMTYVIPSLLEVFTDAGVELPTSTKVILFVSNSFQNYGIYILIGTILSIYLFLKIIKTNKGKRAFDYTLLHLPTIGKIISKVNMARFTRTLSSMIASGVPIVKALDIISETLGNVYYQDSIRESSAGVQKGVSLSEVIKKYDKLYFPLMLHMIEVGEETGTLQETLKQVAEFYEDEVEQITSNLSAIIEPVLMLVIGGGVGLFAVSIIQPMYSIMETM